MKQAPARLWRGIAADLYDECAPPRRFQSPTRTYHHLR
jgi:hypothetical protein